MLKRKRTTGTNNKSSGKMLHTVTILLGMPVKSWFPSYGCREGRRRKRKRDWKRDGECKRQGEGVEEIGGVEEMRKERGRK